MEAPADRLRGFVGNPAGCIFQEHFLSYNNIELGERTGGLCATFTRVLKKMNSVEVRSGYIPVD